MGPESSGEWFALTGATLLFFSVLFGLLESMAGVLFLAAGVVFLVLAVLVRIRGVKGWPPA